MLYCVCPKLSALTSPKALAGINYISLEVGGGNSKTREPWSLLYNF